MIHATPMHRPPLATGVLVALAALAAVLGLLGVLWVALAVGARLALGLAG